MYWNNPNPQGPPPEEPVVDVISEQEVRRFIIRVCLCAFVLCLLSAIPWICVSAIHARVFESIPVPPFVWLILSFLLLSVLSYTPKIPVTRWLSWSLVMGCVFFVTLYHSYYAAILPVWLVGAAMTVSVTLLFLVHLFGAKAPKVLLPTHICTCALLQLGLITLFVLVMLAIFIKDSGIFLASTRFVVFAIALFMAYVQATYIWGRLQQTPYWELNMCSYVIYLNFWILVISLETFVCPEEFYSK